jgi:hypothetical protein
MTQDRAATVPAGEPSPTSGDLGYDEAHDADPSTPTRRLPGERTRPVAVANETDDPTQDYSYDLAHDVPRPRRD